jgi:CDP-4-dehydro-6-deoxyglucose reductase
MELLCRQPTGRGPPHSYPRAARTERQISNRVYDALSPGDTVEVHFPSGDCFYQPGSPEQGLLLIGTGSGLAPLYGIIRNALAQGHTGPIRLFHGSRTPHALYLTERLREFTQTYSNFDYTPCVSGKPVLKGFAKGRAHEIALSELPNLKG